MKSEMVSEVMPRDDHPWPGPTVSEGLALSGNAELTQGLFIEGGRVKEGIDIG